MSDTAITLDEAVRRHVAKALLTAGGNISRAATALGIQRSTLHRMIDRFGFCHGTKREAKRRPLIDETVRAYAERPVRIGEKG